MSSNSKDFTIYPISEKAVTIVFGNQIDEEIREQINGLNQFIKYHPFSGFINTVPAYTTLTIFFEPLGLLADAHLKGSTCLEKITFYLSQFKVEVVNQAQNEGKIISIPVCYEDDFALDLKELAKSKKMDKETIINIHSSAIYKVYMIGFVPSFAYLGGLDLQLASPRKATPRQKVPEGSVGIAGQQTGIYPLETPGGWQIIGRTPLKLFDVNRTQPSLLKSGDSVQFKPISKADFEKIHQKEWA